MPWKLVADHGMPVQGLSLGVDVLSGAERNYLFTAGLRQPLKAKAAGKVPVG